MPGAASARATGRVDLRRLGAGEWLAVVGAVGLLLALFAPWYAVRGEDRSGWDSFAVLDVALVLVAGLGMATGIAAATHVAPALPLAVTVLTATFGAPAVVFVLYRLLDPPAVAAMVRPGAWLGLAATAALTVGAWLGFRREATPGDAGPPVKAALRPAPPR